MIDWSSRRALFGGHSWSPESLQGVIFHSFGSFASSLNVRLHNWCSGVDVYSAIRNITIDGSEGDNIDDSQTKTRKNNDRTHKPNGKDVSTSSSLHSDRMALSSGMEYPSSGYRPIIVVGDCVDCMAVIYRLDPTARSWLWSLF